MSLTIGSVSARFGAVVLLLCFPLFPSPPVEAQDDPFGPATLQARALRGLTGEVASLILKAEPGGELAMEMAAVAQDAVDNGKRRVSVLVEIDGGTFLEHGKATKIRLEIYLYALDAEGAVVDYRAEALVVDVDRDGEAVWQSGLKYYGELSLEPGTYRLRCMVRNYQSKAAGLRELPLAVPAPYAEQAEFMLTPWIRDPSLREPWIPIRPWRPDLLQGLVDEPLEGWPEGSSEAYPFRFAGHVISPSARPVLIPGRTTTLFLRGRWSSRHVFLEVLDFEGTPRVDPVPMEMVDRARGAFGVDTVEWRVDLPESLSSGPVLLRTAAGQGKRKLSSPALVALIADDARDQNLLWADLRRRDVPEAATVQDEPGAERTERSGARRGGRKAKKVAEAYCAALLRIDDLDQVGSLGPIIDFEAAMLEERPQKGAALLQTGEFLAAQTLAEADPEALVPLIQLHQNLYLAYRGRRMFALATHSRVLMERLAELYVDSAGSQGARVLAARALTSLGGYLQKGGLTSTSQRLFRRSVELDPVSTASALALGISYEQIGAYGRAVDTFETMLRRHPKSTEALFRLAMSYERMGNRRAAQSMLEKAGHSGGEPWLRSLILQETSRRELALGRVSDAVDRMADVAHPTAASRIWTAYLQDRNGRAHEAKDMLRPILEGDTDPAQESARKRYDGPPQGAFSETRHELSQAAASRFHLTRALVTGDAP